MTNPRTRRYGHGNRPRRIHLVAPRHPESFWSMQGTVEMFGAKTLMPNAALATLMALTPPDVAVEYSLSDENIGPLDWDRPADLVAVTGATLHADRIESLCRGFRERGLPVALGGTYATIEADRCRGLADFHFTGEAEHTWPRFLREWCAGKPQAVYEQREHVELSYSPAPDWSLIDAADYLSLNVQTSRGCPNRCDFCDAIQYAGRRYRTKSVAQVLAEVARAHSAGARSVFFSDDNFFGNRRFTEALLDALIEWNIQQTRPLSFAAQITVRIGDDVELLRRFADARFSTLFLGVETVRRASLAEVHKEHNLERPLLERIERISRHGIVPFLGLIVGFDHDDDDSFAELLDFVERSASPIAGISLLNAPPHTPLHDRLAAAGRLREQNFRGEWQLDTNVVPLKLDRRALLDGYWTLFQRIYQPDLFERRLRDWISGVDYFTERYVNKKFDPNQLLSLHRMVRYYLMGGPALRRLFIRSLCHARRTHPSLIRRVFTLLSQYRHFRDFVNRPLPIKP